jgi:CheY-like chemotaxis protein
MSAGVAHELNQPLTAIANYAQACGRLLSRPGPDLDDLRTAVREIATQAVRAGEILRRLRGLAQSQPARRERADLNETIQAIRDIILADGRVHRARVRFDLAAGLPAVSIDSAQIQHVILNLVRNGLEAPAVAGVEVRELLLRTRLTSDGEVEISVLDNGPGLASRAVGRMFDLSIRLRAEAAAAERPQVRAESARILLVDDHAGVRDATAMLLRAEGFEVRSAASLAEANEALRENPRVDLVIADYHLQKGETGIEVIAAARQAAGEHIGAVLVSGDISSTLSHVEATERLRLASKPIRSNQLLSLIRELLSPAPPVASPAGLPASRPPRGSSR